MMAISAAIVRDSVFTDTGLTDTRTLALNRVMDRDDLLKDSEPYKTIKAKSMYWRTAWPVVEEEKIRRECGEDSPLLDAVEKAIIMEMIFHEEK